MNFTVRNKTKPFWKQEVRRQCLASIIQQCIELPACLQTLSLFKDLLVSRTVQSRALQQLANT
jgi:hypothetical protein